MPPHPPSRAYVFTVNNPVGELPETDMARYIVWQLEKGEQGTPHWQGYVELLKPQRLGAMKKWLPTAHFEVRWGTRDEAREYCRKDDSRVDGPWERGVWITGPGARTDISAVAEMIVTGCSLREVAAEHPDEFIRMHRGVQALKLAQPTKPREAPEVIVRWGAPGSGKTRWVYDNHELDDVFVHPGGEWFDGYDGHSVALFDDFRGGIKYAYMLRLLDRYPMKVPVKGGFVEWRPTKIVLTSNIAPEEWYPNIADKTALLRRLTKIDKIGDADYVEHTRSDELVL